MSPSSAFLTILSALVLLATATATAAQQAYNYGFDLDEQLAARQASPQQSPFVVKGLPPVRGTIPLRPEVRQLQQSPEKWNLYILGLSMMQYMDQSQQLSWYQIAGIHGVPFQDWGGVRPTPGNEMSGYCTHVSILFPTWHRPYLALYEQVLFRLIKRIASLYPEGEERTRYQSAAEDFRIPYLDWATLPPAGESLLPFIVGGSATANVSGPNGVQEIANPLYTYQFKPLDETAFIEAPYNRWLTTVRAPTSDDASAQSNNSRVALALDRNFPSFQQRLYNLFSNYGNYSTFSNEGWIPEGQEENYDSIESLHDTIHTLTGLNGHMAWIPFSSFDPIFFLHHTMVDRVFAMWQILYPDSWIIPTPAATNSYTTSQGQIQDSQTPLTPFYASTDGTFWTSDTVRDTHAFGYSYAEIAGFSHALKRPNRRAQARVRAAINRLYGASSPASLTIDNARRRDVDHRGQTADPLDPRKFPVYHPTNLEGRAWMGSPSSPRMPPAEKIVNDNKYREWTANIRVVKQALQGPFFIHFFLGEPAASNPQAWAFAANLAGTMSVFASPIMQGMHMGGKFTSGTVPLTSALMRKVADGNIDCLEPDAVEPYLRQNLKLRIVKTDGTVVDPVAVQGLKIKIVSSEVQAPANEEELPSWQGQTSHFDLV